MAWVGSVGCECFQCLVFPNPWVPNRLSRQLSFPWSNWPRLTIGSFRTLMASRYRDCLLLYLDSVVFILRPHSSLISPCPPDSLGKQCLLFALFGLSSDYFFLLCPSDFVPARWPPAAAVPLQNLPEVSWAVIGPFIGERPSPRASLQAHGRHARRDSSA